jgi:hypothetical protein
MESEFNDIHCFSIPGKRCHFAIPHMADAQVKDFVSKLCKKQACAIQFCLQGTMHTQSLCCFNVLTKISVSSEILPYCFKLILTGKCLDWYICHSKRYVM